MEINFPENEGFDPSACSVTFQAVVDGNLIICRVTVEALQDNFSGVGDLPIQAFRASRRAIEKKAKMLILGRRFESDGSILIRASDGA